VGYEVVVEALQPRSKDLGHRCCLENDMMGIESSPVVFDSLEFRLNSDNFYQLAKYDLQHDHYWSDDPFEWGFEWDTLSSYDIVKEILIWDKKPLP
jgi:hypothetical protein